jgi:TonB family protein
MNGKKDMSETSRLRTLIASTIKCTIHSFFVALFFAGVVEGNTVQSHVSAFYESADSADYDDYEVEPDADFHSLQKALVFPDSARHLGIEGIVRILVLIDRDGTPLRVKVQESVHRLLDSAAIQAVRLTSFTPAQKEGKKIASWMSIPIVFKFSTPAPSK